MIVFPYEPPLLQYIDETKFVKNPPKLKTSPSDIRQPWIDLSQKCGVSEFAAKAFFVLGMMRRYVLSANAILKDMNHFGFISAYEVFSSAVELLGRCIHETPDYRQHPQWGSIKRLKKGFEYIKDPYSTLSPEIIISTNHENYDIDDLANLRNLAVHGACITTSQIKADIELLKELRIALYGIPIGDSLAADSSKKGPIRGAIDRYFEELVSGDKDKCERLATAAASPLPFLKLHGGGWPFAERLVNETHQIILGNQRNNMPLVSGGHTRQKDHFKLD